MANTIRIIDGRYNDLFEIEDGSFILVDGKKYQLRYLDPTHFKVVGGWSYHICEFGERVVDKGAKVEKYIPPAPHLDSGESQ